MKKSVLSAVLLTATSVGIVSTNTHAGSYYNCASTTGCELLDSANTHDDYTQTNYPLVLAHGLSGFSRLYGVLDYFHQIPQTLMSSGTDVYATKVSSNNYSEIRGERLLQQIKLVSAVTGKEKVNLLGHSQGGSDIRYVASVAPEYVASVTAVSSPAQGSKMADWILEKVAESSAKDQLPAGEYNGIANFTFKLFEKIGELFDAGSGVADDNKNEQNFIGAMDALSTEHMNTFNAKFPNGIPTEYCGQPESNYVYNGIPYYSWSGVGQLTNPLDPLDYVVSFTALTFDKADKNDGFVSACSSRIGKVIRDDYVMNHFDAANHLLGISAWGDVNVKSLYRMQLNRLKVTEGK